MTKVSFLGLGTMGYPMAGYLATKEKHEVCVYNRTAKKAEKWVKEYGGSMAKTPAEAARDADIVFACVGNDDDLRQVTIGDDGGDNGAFSGMKKGSCFVDHTTVSASVTRSLAEIAASSDIAYVDAPVSGGQTGAEEGILTVMCGGDKKDFDRVKPYIDCYAKKCVLIGGVGSGQLTKMVNQICIAGAVQGLSEAMAFGMRAGLDMDKVINVIGGGAAQSWQMDNRAETMVADSFDFGFAVDWMRKDLGICLSQAKDLGAHLPVTALVDQFYSQLQEKGYGRCDTSSLVALLTKDKG